MKKKLTEENRTRILNKFQSNWKLSKIGRHFKLERGRVISKEEIQNNIGIHPVYSSQTSYEGKLGSINSYDFEGDYISWTTDGAYAGTCFHRTGKFNVTNVCGLLSPHVKNKFYLKFLNYYLNILTKFYVRWDINPKLMNDMMSEVPCFLIPYNEQINIVKTIEDKIKPIDDLINKIYLKKKLIIECIQSFFFEKTFKDKKFVYDQNLWFQKLPSDWEIVKFSKLFEPIKIINKGNEKLLSVNQELGVVFRDDQIKNVVYPSEDLSKYKFVEPGNIIISLRSADGGLETSDIKGIVSSAYIVLRTKDNIDTNFFRFLFKSKNFIVELRRYITGIRDGKNIYFEDIRNIPIPYNSSNRWSEVDKKIIKLHSNSYNLLKLMDKKLTLLEEYKNSIILNCITGKQFLN
jgi:type I restriction enzyme, S subunit